MNLYIQYTLAIPNRRFQKYFSYKSGKNHIYLFITLELYKNKSQTSILDSIPYVLFGLKRFGLVWFGLSGSHFIDAY